MNKLLSKDEFDGDTNHRKTFNIEQNRAELILSEDRTLSYLFPRLISSPIIQQDKRKLIKQIRFY